MPHAPGHAIISYATSSFGGTPPFATTFDFSPVDTWGQTELDDFATACGLQWETNVAPKISDGLTGGTISVRLLTEGFIITSEQEAGDGAVDANPRLPGASFRILKNAALPAGGRRGCMYLPGAPGTKYDENGHVTDSNVGAAVQDWMDLCMAFVDVPINFRQNHTVDGVATATTYETVTQAATVSFLRGRYR